MSLRAIMKPARGSARSSKQTPKDGGGKRKQQPLPNAETLPKKTRKSVVPAMDRKLKSQTKWKLLDKSSIAVLDNMMSLSVLSLLTQTRREKEDCQKHLNLLKDQFLVKCAQLHVPTPKYGNLMRVSREFQTECAKIKQGEKKIETLEESSRIVVSRLEQLEEQMNSLESSCRIMRDRLEEEEENAQEFLQLPKRSVLHLPALPASQKDEPTLQERMMKMVASPKAVMKALQNSRVTGDVRTFLELAHKQADEMLTRPLTADSENEML